jgi:hypothetical protein
MMMSQRSYRCHASRLGQPSLNERRQVCMLPSRPSRRRRDSRGCSLIVHASSQCALISCVSVS